MGGPKLIFFTELPGDPEWEVENEGMHDMPEIWGLDEAVELQTLHDGYPFVLHPSIYHFLSNSC